MNYIGKIISNIGLAYSEINPATLTGAIDVIIVEQADGSFKCSPFHVRFGKMGVIRSKEKIVDIEINGIPVDIHMKLGDSGEAYFLEEYDEVEAGEEVLTAAITTTSSTSPTATTEVQSPPPPSDTLNDNAETTAENSDATKDDDKTVGDTAEAVAADADAQKQQPLNGGDSQPPIKEQEPSTSSETTHCDTTAAAAEADQSTSEAASATSSTTTVPTDSMSKSDSVTSVSVSLSSDRSGAGSQKRYRRKKKNRASSKPSLPSAEATKSAGEQQQQNSSINDDSPLKSGEHQQSTSTHDHQTPSTSSATTNHQYTDGELHPFSDSEVGHIAHHIYKKQESIDPYDCKSDSEYEIFKANTQTSAEKAGVAEHDNISWDWGELPNVSSGCAAAAAAAAAVAAHQKDSLANGNGAKMEVVVVGGSTHTQHAENKRSTSPRSSMLGGMLGFIKGGETAAAAPMSPGTGSNSTAVPSNGHHHPHYPQHQNHPNNDEDKGIYLDDLDPNDMNPEVAAKYFPKFSPNPNSNSSNSSSSHFLTQPANRSSHTSDEDVESGTGPSLSNSPHSTEYNYPTTISTHRVPSTSDFASEYSQLLNSNDLSLLSTFDLSTLSKVYHDMSMSLCGGIENLVENPGDTEHFLQSIISFDDFSENPLAILNDPNLVVRMGGRYFTWKMASAIILSLLMFQRPLPETTMDSLREQCIPKKKKPPPVSAQNSSASSWRNWSIFRSNTSESSSANVQTIDETSSGGGGGQHSAENSTETRSLNSSNSSEGVAMLQSKQLGTPSHKMSNNLNNSLEYTSDEETMNIVLSSHKTSGPGTAVTSTPGTTANSTSTTNSSTESSTATSTPGHTKSKVRYRKVLRLKSDIVRSLNLKRNCNDVMFSVTTAFQGTTVCRSKIFLWRWDDKVVISDIDGTITKSDVLGHILPYIGKDWAQLGVTQLYSNIEANSYRFLYLSARAIGQAKTTREYLRDLRQDDIGLPDGPLLLSPTSLFSALHREVIEKKPEEFKIACLKDIQSLFPENPFFAGFGNKINDNWAYKAVGIDSSRIFTINHKGELRLDRLLSFKSSYTDLSQFVDQMFPPLQQSAYYDGYSSFMFWRPDIPELDDAELKDAKD